MCRFLCYRGPEILLSDLLYKPANSLILQSFHAKERTEPLNGDGVGVGWYTPEITSTPCVSASLTPAWSNHNLRQLSDHVKSGCFFAHVRAASPGMRVSEANCHPFNMDVSYGCITVVSGTSGALNAAYARLCLITSTT